MLRWRLAFRSQVQRWGAGGHNKFRFIVSQHMNEYWNENKAKPPYDAMLISEEVFGQTALQAGL